MTTLDTIKTRYAQEWGYTPTTYELLGMYTDGALELASDEEEDALAGML